jgi:hypothetical protein
MRMALVQKGRRSALSLQQRRGREGSLDAKINRWANCPVTRQCGVDCSGIVPLDQRQIMMNRMTERRPVNIQEHAITAVRHREGIDIFCGIRALAPGEAYWSPFVLAVDETVVAAFEDQIGVHVSSSDFTRTSVHVVGVIVGGGHPAVLSSVNRDGSLQFLREVDTTILFLEILGQDARTSDETQYSGVRMYEPREVAEARRKPWWRFWSKDKESRRMITRPNSARD